jgi:hypothetical protein
MRDSLVVSSGIRPVGSCQNFNLGVCLLIPHTETCQRVDSIDVHGAASANSLAATPPERQGRVHLILDPDKRIEHHGTGLVQVERVRLHLGLR